jgi:hypothetical protein
MLSINRSSRSARFLAALGATTALAGGVSAALAASDAHAMPCELRGTQTQKACTDGNDYPIGPGAPGGYGVPKPPPA